MQSRSLDFPVTPDSYDPFNENRESNLFITKLNSDGNSLIFSTYFKYGEITDISIDDFNDIYLVGLTGSYKFPITVGSYNYEHNRTLHKDYQADIFITKFDKEGKSLIFSTHLGGSATEEPRGTAVNSLGDVFVVGSTKSLDFPTTIDAYNIIYNGGDNDAFIIKITDKIKRILEDIKE